MPHRNLAVRLAAAASALLLLSCASSAGVVAYAQESIDLQLPKLETRSSDQTGHEILAATTSAAKPDPELEALEEQADPSTLKAIDLYIEGDVQGAFDLFRKVYESNPDSDPPGVLLALLHSHAGRFVEMRRCLEQSAEDFPSDPEAFLQLANIDAQEGRFLETELLVERAETLIDKYAELFPESTSRLAYFREEALSTRANLAEKRGRNEAAEALTRKVTELNPENAQAWWNLGYLSMKQKKYDAAEEAFDSAAKLNPSLWAGWLQVLSMLDHDDLVDEAKGRAETKKEQIENATKAEKAQLARLYLRWYMFDDAFAIVKGFEDQNEERDIDRWLLSGWLGLYANKYAAAEEFFRNATLIDPTNFEATNGLALALLDQSNKEKIGQARVIAARNYRAQPDSQEAATTYAWCLFLSGNTKESDSLFQPMLESGKMSASVAYYLAEIANVRGDQDLALNLLDLALSQKANFPKRSASLELKEIVEAQLKGEAPAAEEEEDPVKKDFDEPDFEEVEPEDF